MSLWRRLKNLWYLSGLDYHETATEPVAKDTIIMPLVKRQKMAKIVEPAFLDQFDV